MCCDHINQFDVVRNPQVIMGEHEHEEQVQLFHVDVVRPIKYYVTESGRVPSMLEVAGRGHLWNEISHSRFAISTPIFTLVSENVKHINYLWW